MARLCGRPGCSEVGAVAYGMVPEDLLFWIAPLSDAPVNAPSVLCRRHADAMVVPMGWTLDDRRDGMLRLFTSRPAEPAPSAAAAGARRPRRRVEQPEQLQIDGTGEIERPRLDAEPERPTDAPDAAAPLDGPDRPADDGPTNWEPEFDHDDDLDGLLEVKSPLLARAFNGTDRRRR